MTDTLIRYYTLAGGILGLLATLMRVAYLMGKLLETFRKHVKDADHTDADHETRIRSLEAIRRR